MELNEISGAIVDSALEEHIALGPGLLEEVYKKCLKAELLSRGVKVLSEVGLPVRYKNISVDLGYRIDLLVENLVIVELKSVQQITSIHKAQLFTHIKPANKPLGLLLNFNSRLMKEGILRVIL